MKINWTVRAKNPAFWVGIFGVFMSPILAYNGMAFEDITTWGSFADLIVSFVMNPFLVGSVIMAVLGFLGVAIDPTTSGVKDSYLSQAYDRPVNHEKELADAAAMEPEQVIADED